MNLKKAEIASTKPADKVAAADLVGPNKRDEIK